MAKEHVPLRIEPEQVKQLDRIASVLQERTEGGVEVTRSDAARAVFAVGLPILEERLGLTARTRKGAKTASKPTKAKP